MTKEQFMEIAGWIADDKCEYDFDHNNWSRCIIVGMNDDYKYFRHKSEPKLRPFKIEEVKLGWGLKVGPDSK